MSLATAESHPLQQQRAALQAMMASLGCWPEDEDCWPEPRRGLHPDAQAEDEDCWPEDEDCWPEPRRGLHPDAQAEDEDWWPEGEEPRVKTIKVRKTIMRFQAAPVRIPAPPLKAPPGSQGAKGTGKGTKGDVAKRLRDMMATGKGKDLRKALAVSKAKAATAPWKHGSFWC
jgi:hypothetical protein